MRQRFNYKVSDPLAENFSCNYIDNRTARNYDLTDTLKTLCTHKHTHEHNIHMHTNVQVIPHVYEERSLQPNSTIIFSNDNTSL